MRKLVSPTIACSCPPVRIYKDNITEAVKGQVVITAVPQDDFGLPFRHSQYLLVVDAGINHKAFFCLPPVLQWYSVFIQVLIGGKPLTGLLFQVTRVRVADDNHFSPFRIICATFLGLLFPTPVRRRRPKSPNIGVKHGSLRPHQSKIRTSGQDKGGPIHHIFVGGIAVGKDHFVHSSPNRAPNPPRRKWHPSG